MQKCLTYIVIHRGINSWPSIQTIDSSVFGSGKTNALLNVINHQQDTDLIYLHAKDRMKQDTSC